ncbi:hypothetical protein PTKIN_Ptkin11bG0071500 [Pterospermum kingtungense]
MCVSLCSALVNTDKTDRPEPRLGFSKKIVSEVEKSITGNLYCCIGYQSIVDACETFATDVDTEDLGFNSFWKKGKSDEVKLSGLPPYNHNNATCIFLEFLKKESKTGSVLHLKHVSGIVLLVLSSLKAYCKWMRRMMQP